MIRTLVLVLTFANAQAERHLVEAWECRAAEAQFEMVLAAQAVAVREDDGAVLQTVHCEEPDLIDRLNIGALGICGAAP